MTTVFFKTGEFAFTAEYDEMGLDIRVPDSYLVNDKEKIAQAVGLIRSQAGVWDKMLAAGYDRTEKSMCQEWAAHNLLYDIGYKRDHTKDVDMDNAESGWRKMGYWFLSLFYRGGKSK